MRGCAESMKRKSVVPERPVPTTKMGPCCMRRRGSHGCSSRSRRQRDGRRGFEPRAELSPLARGHAPFGKSGERAFGLEALGAARQAYRRTGLCFDAETTPVQLNTEPGLKHARRAASLGFGREERETGPGALDDGARVSSELGKGGEGDGAQRRFV